MRELIPPKKHTHTHKHTDTLPNLTLSIPRILPSSRLQTDLPFTAVPPKRLGTF